MCREEKPKKAQRIQVPEWVIWYVLFLIVVTFWHLLMREYSGDAVNVFSKGLDSNTLIDILKNRYETWSSRVFVEAFLYLLSRNVALWKVCNIAIYALFAYSLLRLTNFKYPKLTLGLWITYPIIEMASAGWIATYMNYFWPLAIGTYAMISLYKIYNDEKIRPVEWITFSLATLFATNVEQVGVLFVCILFCFGIVYYVIKKSKRAFWFYVLQCVITLGNMAFILLSPGNSVRTWKEIANWMHDFGTISMIDKGVLGVVITMNKLVTGNLNFLFFVTMIFVLSIISQHCRKEEEKAKRILIEICYTLPFVFTAALTILKNTSGTYFAQIQSLFSNIVKVDATNWNNFKYYIPFIVYMLMIMAIIIALLNLFDDINENFRLAILFVIGLLTRVVLGFSPTLYASSMRTFIFFDAILIFSIVRMYDCSEKLRCKLPAQTHKIGSYIFSAMVALSILNNTIAICGRM